MWRIVKTELWKLKRYNIIWAGITLMLLSILLTLFTSMAKDGSVWDFRYLIEQVIKNNMSTIFPMCITLIAGYIITREQKDDTLKNILTIPISFKQLLISKLIVCGMLSLFLGIVCTVFTIIAEIFAGFPNFSLGLTIQALWQITLVNLFLYLAVIPIIIITSHLTNGFLAGVIVAFVYGYVGMLSSDNMLLANLCPITAGLGIIQYRSYDSSIHWNVLLNLLSIGISLFFSILLIHFTGNSIKLKKASKKAAKHTPKKGW
ncbi:MULTISPECIES: ABC transporter permease [Clostridium]|uniref:ABC-2 family transporter protein n=1 Tax=Clostridium ragsdalei P11 TaxID=1353534 RepID=A0A1A6AHZ7_9CLOT|nr:MULTISPECIES: ABC transporter permease [Clostridium]OBR89671.1 ABC-2 family transporter protein [Clostridium ragsdalei P11]QXE21062.1 lantibiotic ABC transporter permease [Clostridium sp. 001]